MEALFYLPDESPCNACTSLTILNDLKRLSSDFVTSQKARRMRCDSGLRENISL